MNSNNSKTKKYKERIDTYSTVYESDLVVANSYTNTKKLAEQYEWTGEGTLEDILSEGSIATTVYVTRKKDNKRCHIVIVHSPYPTSIEELIDLANTCTHEAVHVMLDIYYNLGAKVDTYDQEIFAYNVGYISECIFKTIYKK